LEHGLQADLGSYIGKLLRDSFGRGPGSVFVSIDQTIVTVYLRNFLSPTEQILMTQQQEILIQQTRDKLMQSLIPEIKAYVRIYARMDINEFYYDWSLHNKTGLFVCVCSNEQINNEEPIGNDYNGKEEIHDEINKISIEAEKLPEKVSSTLLNDRTLMVIRGGILVRIEKEFIRMGLSESLRIAKRTLEKNLLHNTSRFESILNCKVSDIFVDWDFNLDKSAIVLILNPTTK
jgi:uncharacterized protein YbcI